MNRRSLFSFLAAAPFGILAAAKGARAAPTGLGRPHFHLRSLTEAERDEFRRRYIDIDRVIRDEADLLVSRRFEIEQICRFMDPRMVAL